MENNPAGFETVLMNAKTELDDIDGRLKALRASEENLKPQVIEYNDLKHQEKDLRKLRHIKLKEFEIKKSFFEAAK